MFYYKWDGIEHENETTLSANQLIKKNEISVKRFF